jgi:hypothetical protein
MNAAWGDIVDGFVAYFISLTFAWSASEYVF